MASGQSKNVCTQRSHLAFFISHLKLLASGWRTHFCTLRSTQVSKASGATRHSTKRCCKKFDDRFKAKINLIVKITLHAVQLGWVDLSEFVQIEFSGRGCTSETVLRARIGFLCLYSHYTLTVTRLNAVTVTFTSTVKHIFIFVHY